MEIVDEEGRLFGTVNVVDALVVLFVLAVGLAGVALVTGGGPTTAMETQYVTLDLGTQPDYLVEQIEAGDVDTLEDAAGNITITDTYVTTAQGGTHAVVRAAVSRPESDGAITLDGGPLRVGRNLHLENESYSLNATISDVGPEPTLPTEQRTVVLRGTVPSDVAADVTTDTEIRIGGNRVATVEDVATYDATDPDRRTLFLDASLRTYASGDTVRFGGTRVETGSSILLPVAGYQFNGTIDRVGGGLEQSSRDVLVTTTVGADTAREMGTGDTYSVAGREIATIENLTAYGTSDPDRTRIYAGLSLRTLEYGEAVRFGAEKVVREGTTLPFRTDAYEFGAEIVERRTSDLGVRDERVLVTDVVDVDVARAVSEGDAYEVAGEATATIENVAVYGTDDPDRKRMYVGLSVRTLGYGEVPRFGANTRLREGATVPFRTLDYEFAGEVVRRGTFAQSGQSTTRTVTLRMKNVAPERADGVGVGMTETNADQTIARVTNVDVQPAIVTLTSESGDIFEREHPVNETVTLTVDLSVRERDTGVRFKGRTLQEGNRVTLDLGTTTINATVVDLDGG